ncbi:MAG: hypothetical protein P8X63_14555, partial [Desulfuromonadaceae bacterium]
MRDLSVNSYNLQEAKKILATLVTKTSQAGREEAGGTGSSYVRMLPRVEPSPPAAMPEEKKSGYEAPLQDSVAPPKESFVSWDDCIAWCMQVTRSEAAFVVDSQGFIIAMRGRVPSHGFECTGAELVYAMDQLQRIDPEAGKLHWIDLDYHKRRVVGMVTVTEAEECFIVGMISPDGSYKSVKNIVARQIVDSLETM